MLLRWLGRVEPSTTNTLIAYATKPNAIAEDGNGPNSPFTVALVKHLMTPGLDLRIALGHVRDEVLASTGSKQEPYITGSLGGGTISIVSDVTLKPGVVPAPMPLTEADRMWSMVKDTHSIFVLEAFRSKYGAANPVYDSLAEERIKTLRKQTARPPQKTPAAAQHQAEQKKAEQIQLPENVDLAKVRPTTVPNAAPSESVDKWLQGIAFWRVIKREFPDWYSQRVSEAAVLQDEALLSVHLARKLVQLRKQQSAVGLSATPERLRTVAVAYLDSLTRLRGYSAEACAGFIRHGEAAPLVTVLYLRTDHTAHLSAVLTAIIEAIVDGRKLPRVYPPPTWEHRQMLATALAKRGWTADNFQLIASDKAMAQAAPDKLCQLVHEFFATQLALPVLEAQMRLLVDSLRPVFNAG